MPQIEIRIRSMKSGKETIGDICGSKKEALKAMKTISMTPLYIRKSDVFNIALNWGHTYWVWAQETNNASV